jgi:hypothetical protein
MMGKIRRVGAPQSSSGQDGCRRIPRNHSWQPRAHGVATASQNSGGPPPLCLSRLGKAEKTEVQANCTFGYSGAAAITIRASPGKSGTGLPQSRTLRPHQRLFGGQARVGGNGAQRPGPEAHLPSLRFNASSNCSHGIAVSGS